MDDTTIVARPPRTPTLMGPVPGWNPDAAEDFFDSFVRERHQMFRRRVVWQEPPPWTDDPVLATCAFTSPYRELDRGTRYASVCVLGATMPVVGLVDPMARFWSLLVYRRFNLIATHEVLEKAGYTDPARFEPAEVVECLLSLARAGRQIFTGAYRINFTASQYHGPKEGAKIRQTVERLTVAHRRLDHLYSQLRAAPTMATAHTVLTALPGLAEFSAYQLLVDLTYPEGLFHYPDQNDWATFGPGTGTEQGLAELGVRPADGLRAMRWLRDHQPEWPGPRLTMPNLAHCLCEYSKLCRIRRGEPAKRRYAWARANPDLSPWDAATVRRFSVRRTPI